KAQLFLTFSSILMLQPGPLKAARPARIELDHGPTPGHGEANSSQKRSVLGVVVGFPQDIACAFHTLRAAALNDGNLRTRRSLSLSSTISGRQGATMDLSATAPRLD